MTYTLVLWLLFRYTRRWLFHAALFDSLSTWFASRGSHTALAQRSFSALETLLRCAAALVSSSPEGSEGTTAAELSGGRTTQPAQNEQLYRVCILHDRANSRTRY